MGLDRVTTVTLDLSSLGGKLPVVAVDSTVINFDNVNTDYDGTPLTATSSFFDSAGKQGITLEFNIKKTGTPTGVITIEVLTADSTSPSTNGSVHTDFLGDYSFVAASVATHPNWTEESVVIEALKAQAIAIRVTAAGVSGANYYTIAGMKAY